MKKIKVREIFYTLQGEGAMAGTPAVFIRLSNCNLNCWFCDTDWSTGDEMTIEELLDRAIKILPEQPLNEIEGTWIVWTGGEPTLQLTQEIVQLFTDSGFKQAIETNGTNAVPKGIDYISCAPKMPFVDAELLHKNFPNGVGEFRFPCGRGELPIPIKDLPLAGNYFVSPLFLGEAKKRFKLSVSNLKYCINWVKENPEWRLSVQQHKIWDIR